MENKIKEYINLKFPDEELKIELLNSFKGLSRSRSDIYFNYISLSNEVNISYFYKIKFINTNVDKFVLLNYISNEDQELIIFSNLEELEEEMQFRLNNLNDIFDEIKLFKSKVEEVENALGKNLSFSIRISRVKDENYYKFNLYKDEDLIEDGFINVNDINLLSHLSEYERSFV